MDLNSYLFMKLKTQSIIILGALPQTISLYAQTEDSPVITSFAPINGPIGVRSPENWTVRDLDKTSNFKLLKMKRFTEIIAYTSLFVTLQTVVHYPR